VESSVRRARVVEDTFGRIGVCNFRGVLEREHGLTSMIMC
jgi:hypothetical protein